MKYFSELNEQDQDRVIMRALANNKPQGLARAKLYNMQTCMTQRCAILKIYWDDLNRLVCDVIWDHNRQITKAHDMCDIKYHDDVRPELTADQLKANYAAVKQLYMTSKVYMFDDKLRLCIKDFVEDDLSN